MTPKRRDSPLIKQGDTWWCDFYHEGKRVRRSMRTAQQMVALDRLQQLRERLQLKDGEGRLPLDGFSRKYITWAWAEKPASASREDQRLKKIIEYLKVHHNVGYLDEITTFHIDQLKAELKTWPGIGGNRLSKKTINYHLIILRNLFKQARVWGDYEGKDPTAAVRLYRGTRRRKGLTAAQEQKALAEAQRISERPRSPLQRAFYDLCLFARHTGLRRGEMLSLRWKDIGDGWIHVHGKGDKDREVPLNKMARDVIARQPHRSEYVFDVPNRNARALTAPTYLRIRERTGVPFSLHLMRHSFTSDLIERGVDIKTVAELLGHSEMSMTAIYAHTTRERKTDAVRLLVMQRGTRGVSRRK